MERVVTPTRANWQGTIAECGIMHSPDRWNESAYYRFAPDQIEEIRLATEELHLISLQAVQYVIDHNLFADLGITDPWIIEFVKKSWMGREDYIVSRLDLAFDGKSAPQLLEYNGDNPSMIVESGWVQDQWLLEKFGDEPVDQFSGLHEALIRRWESVFGRAHVHFSCHDNDKEAMSNVIYMREIANAAGCVTTDILVNDIGWDSMENYFVDTDNKAIKNLCKTYPCEWMLKESFGRKIPSAGIKLIEPSWKMLLTSKGILKILWKLFPGHPNLLPAHDTYVMLKNGFVKKPLFGRAGLNVTIQDGSGTERTGGEPESEKYVYQGVAAIPNFSGFYPIVSSFIVGDEAVGIGIKEDMDRITSQSAKFVPHVVYGKETGDLQ